MRFKKRYIIDEILNGGNILRLNIVFKLNLISDFIKYKLLINIAKTLYDNKPDFVLAKIKSKNYSKREFTKVDLPLPGAPTKYIFLSV